MNDSVIFNWPSGASGDFILSIKNVLGSIVTPVYYPKANRFDSKDYTLSNVVRDFSNRGILNYNEIRYDRFIHSHQLQDDIPNNIVIINIDNEGYEQITSGLYIAKSSDKEDILDLPFYFIDSSVRYKHQYSNRLNFHNYFYHNIFIEPDKNTIVDLFSKLGIDISQDYGMIVECIELYRDINKRILKNLTIRSLYENDMEYLSDPKAIDTLSQLHDYLIKRNEE